MYFYTKLTYSTSNTFNYFTATSTDSFTIRSIKNNIETTNLISYKDVVTTSDMNGNPYYIHVEQDEMERQKLDTTGVFWFYWHTIKQLCQNGWEPFNTSHEDQAQSIDLRRETS